MQNLETANNGKDLIYGALSKFQSKLKSVPKTKVNPYFKSTYADLADVWDHCHELLGEFDLSINHTFKSVGADVWIIATLGHKSGQEIVSELPLFMAKRDNHGLGAAITYARRYTMGALLGISTEEDDDGNASTGRKGLGLEKTVNKPQDAMQKRDEFLSKCKDKNDAQAYLDSFLNIHKTKSLDETIDYFSANLNEFHQRIDTFKQSKSSKTVAQPAAVAA